MDHSKYDTSGHCLLRVYDECGRVLRIHRIHYENEKERTDKINKIKNEITDQEITFVIEDL